MRPVLLKCLLAFLLLDVPALGFPASVLLSGFEPGLAGWSTIGDVSSQGAAVGLAPTQGAGMAFVTTLGPLELPYSGTPSPNDGVTREFLGMPSGIPQFMAVMPPVSLVLPGGGIIDPPIVGEGGAMKYHFYAPVPGVVSLDWDRIGRDGDSAFMSVWSDDNSIRINDWIYFPTSFKGTFKPSSVDLCAHLEFPGDCLDPAKASFYNVATGWMEKSVRVLQPGWYTIGFGVGEVAEGTTPTVLALDNLLFTPLPEPGTAPQMAAAAIVLALAARRRATGKPPRG